MSPMNEETLREAEYGWQHRHAGRCHRGVRVGQQQMTAGLPEPEDRHHVPPILWCGMVFLLKDTVQP